MVAKAVRRPSADVPLLSHGPLWVDFNNRTGSSPERPASLGRTSSRRARRRTAGTYRRRRRTPTRCIRRCRSSRIGRSSRCSTPGRRRPSCTNPSRGRRCRCRPPRSRRGPSRRLRRRAYRGCLDSRRVRHRRHGGCRSSSRSRCSCSGRPGPLSIPALNDRAGPRSRRWRLAAAYSGVKTTSRGRVRARRIGAVPSKSPPVG